MKRLKYILILTLLAVTTLVTAQENYVIDSVCIGSDRDYRIKGENGSTYDWFVLDTFGVTLANPAYTDFREDDNPNPGDTIWGSEINYLWNTVGDFDILTLHYSEHGCDTVEQGRVKVFPIPEAEAGPDAVICELSDIVVSGDEVWNQGSLLWTSNGDGTFSDNTQLHPTYYLGSNDNLNYSVTLFLTAYGLADNGSCTPAVDSVTFNFGSPDIAFTVQEILCYNDNNASITANITDGLPPYTYSWKGSNGYVSSGSNTINGLGAGTYILTVTDANFCQDIDSVEIINPLQLISSIDDVQHVSCYGYADGFILASAVGGTGNLNYSWTGPSGFTANGNSISNLSGGSYLLTVSDENDCIDTATVIVEEPDLLLAEITADDTVLCEGDVINLFGKTVGGNGTFTHRWTGVGSIYLNDRYVPDVVFSNAPAGTYNLIYTIVDENLCEASDSIELNVYPPTYSNNSLEICFGEAPFTWNNRTILSDADRIYRDTLFGMNQYGCDSLLTLEVDVLFPIYDDTTLYVCANEEPFVVFSQTIIPGRDSIYLDTLRYVDSGCDSLLITLEVFTLPVTENLLDTTLCAGANEFVWNNVTILTDYDSIYLDTLVNVYGCDSLLTYDVKINPPDTLYVDSTFCQDEPEFVWNGLTILTQYDSIYQATLPNQFGCDSIVNLNVHLLPVTDTMIDAMLCYGTPEYAWNNLIIYAEHDSTYLDTLVNQYGCDSLLTLNVNVIYPDTINLDTMLCEGVPEFAWNSHAVYAFNDSIYSDTLQNQFGCDSIVNLDVRILLPEYFTDTLEFCATDDPFAWYSNTILTDRDSIYFDTLYYAAGCDSLRLQLEIISHPVSDTLIDIVLCEGSPEFVWNSHAVSTSIDSTYLDTLQNVWGCDSTITFVVDIVPAFKDTFPETICYGEPLADWYGQIISSTIDSTYLQLLPDPSGCDTLLFYEVTVLPVTDAILDTTLCAGLPEFMWNNRLISTTADGVYLDTLQNSFGCDSLLTYNVTIIPPDTLLVDTLLCFGTPEFDWNEFTVSTTVEDEYEASLTNAGGCDSIVILNVTLINGTSSDTSVWACEEYTWLEGDGNTYTSSDTYIYTIGGAACADTMRLHLIVSPPIDLIADPVDVLCYGDSSGAINLTINGGIAPYQVLWNTGDTTELLNNLPAGTYSVWVTDLGCSESLDVLISEPPALQITLDKVTDVATSGSSDGSIEVSVSGGTPGYTFEWTNESGVVVGIDEDLFSQPAGTYTLLVTDANDCPSGLTATIKSPVPSPATCPEDVTLICFEELAAYPMATSLSEYLAQDTLVGFYSDCGIDTSTFAAADSIVSSSIYCYEELRTYSVIDSCGNTLSCQQSVIVNDTENPTISCPPTITVTNDIVPAAFADTTEFLAAGGLFSDNCGIVSFNLVNESTVNNGDHETVTRTYEVEDYCGNTDECIQVIEIYQNADFVIECAGLPPVAYECKAELPRYNNLDEFRDAGGYAYSYPLDIVSFTYSDASNGRTCPETITRTYTIKNENGEESCTQIFIIDDKTPPTLILPDKYITCKESVPVYANYVEVILYGHGNQAFDNCGNRSIQAVTPLKFYPGEGSCPTVYKRVYSITDWCNNSFEATEYIYMIDTIAPVIHSTPGDLSTDCLLPDPYANYAEFVAAGGNVTEECGTFAMLHVGDSTAGPSEPGGVYRTYRFSDVCGNDSDYIQKITVLDTVPPEIGIPDLILDCEPVNIATLEEFIDAGGWFNDNCEIDSSSFKLFYSVTFDSVCPKVYVNRYEIYDRSGNRGWTEHTITVIDIEIPLLLCPPSDTIDASEAFPLPFSTLSEFRFGGGDAFDNCSVDPATFTLVSADSSISVCESWITYTYQVADYCGNWSDECSYTIYRNDVIKPQMFCMSNVTVECIDDVPDIFKTYTEYTTGGGSATDNYRLDTTSFIHLKDSIEGVGCPLVITRTYQIKDVCGNSAICSYQITVNDITPPVMVCPPDSSVECLANIMHDISTIDEFYDAGGTISDNCEFNPASFAFNKTTTKLIDRTEIITTYYIEDLCGNADSCVHTLILTDTIPPVANCIDTFVYLLNMENYIFTDGDILQITEGSTDNCTNYEDLIIDIDFHEFSCDDVEDIVVLNIVITDEAGNATECVTNITVEDIMAPVAVCDSITIYLDENGQASIDPSQIDNGSYDNCGIDSMFLSQYVFDCTNVGDNVVQLVVIDVSSLRSECTAVVTVIDTIAPEVICIPELITIQLDGNAEYKLTVEELIIGSSDVCGVDSMFLDDYELDCDNIGTTLITVTTVDVNGNQAQCVAELTVYGNLPPNALNDSAITAQDVPVEIDIISNDYDIKTTLNISTLALYAQPSNGTIDINPINGNLTYTPNPGFFGEDELYYVISDDGIPCVPMSDTALVYIKVLKTNLPPVAIDDYFSATCSGIFGDLIGNDSDPDSNELNIDTTPVKQPMYGELVIYADGTFSYIPDGIYLGIDSFVYEMCDAGVPSECDRATVYIEISQDTDCDGIVDIDDIDDDNDGILDVVEGDRMLDSDLDGIPNSLDIDADDDGIVDNVEGQEEGNYIPPTGLDSNNNGWDDAYDPADGGYEFIPADTDEDSTPDYLDLDSENDNVYDFIEGHDINADGIPDVTRIFVDTDRDGLDDIYDTVFGWNDPNDPFNALGSNSPLQDFDQDGTRDWRDINDENDDFLTKNEDLNNDGDYSNDDLDLDGYPEYLDKTLDCELFIPEGFSPNGDNVHDFFQILCIQRYPEANLMIFNRNGNKLFEKDHYGNLDYWGSNQDAWWWGISEHKWTIGQLTGLPAGNYVYVLELGTGRVEKGTVMISY